MSPLHHVLVVKILLALRNDELNKKILK